MDSRSAGPVSIGHLARETSVKVQTIRYYEQIGLLPRPARSAGNQRRYGPEYRRRLAFIHHSRQLGFPLSAVRALLGLADTPDRPCEAADRAAREQLEQVEHRLSQLAALKRELQRMIAECGGGRVAECRVIGVLADHRQCLQPDHAASDPLQSHLRDSSDLIHSAPA